MDYTFLADIYAKTGAVHPRLWSGIVFVLGGGLACLLWWGIGQNYLRQQAALTRATETDNKIEALSKAVGKLQFQEAKPVVVHVPQAAKELPHPVLSVSDNHVSQDDKGCAITVRLTFTNSSTFETVAKLRMHIWHNNVTIAGGETEQAFPPVSSTPKINLTKDVRLPEAVYAEWLSTGTGLTVVASATYMDKGAATTYEFTGRVKPKDQRLDVLVNRWVSKQASR